MARISAPTRLGSLWRQSAYGLTAGEEGARKSPVEIAFWRGVAMA